MKFSIIIPVYNVMPYLRECLDSVLEQTFTDWEAICVDDGSTDGSGAILDEYAAKDARFRIISQKNAGVSAARNAALDIAQGEWVAFVDGDDVVDMRWLSVMWSAIEECQPDVVRIGYVKFAERAKPIFQHELECGVTSCDVAHELTLEDVNSFMCEYVFHSSLVHGIRFRPYIGGEDRLFTIMCLAKARVMAKKRDKLYGYRQRASSAVHAPTSFRKLESELGYMAETLEFCAAHRKIIPFAKVPFVSAFMGGGIFRAMQMLSHDEKIKLYEMWRRALPLIIESCSLTTSRRMMLRICKFFPFYSVSWMLCYAFPRLLGGRSPVRVILRKFTRNI